MEAARQFKCPKCPSSFVKLRGLLRHKQLSHGPALYMYCRRCNYFDKRRGNLKRHYKALHPECMEEFDGIHVEPARPAEENKGAPSSGKGAAVEVRRVCQEAEPLLERLSWKPALISPLAGSSQRARQHTQEAPVADDDTFGIATSIPPLDFMSDMEKDTTPTPVTPSLTPKAPTPPAAKPSPQQSNPPPGTTHPRVRISPQRPRIPKLATIVEHVQTYTYVDNILIHREVKQHTYLQDVLVDCTFAFDKRH